MAFVVSGLLRRYVSQECESHTYGLSLGCCLPGMFILISSGSGISQSLLGGMVKIKEWYKWMCHINQKWEFVIQI